MMTSLDDMVIESFLLQALSNMPADREVMENNSRMKTIHFAESPVMSTYLVAFVVGLFDYVQDAYNDVQA